MLDAGENVWSMRRGRAQFHRIAVLLNVLVFVAKHFDEKKITTVLSYFMFLYVVFCPWIILPSTILFLLLVGIWCYRTWPRYPSHTDIKLSHVDTTTVEELEEEFDNPFPSKFSGDNLRTRLTLPHSSLWWNEFHDVFSKSMIIFLENVFWCQVFSFFDFEIIFLLVNNKPLTYFLKNAYLKMSSIGGKRGQKDLQLEKSKLNLESKFGLVMVIFKSTFVH